MTAESSPIVSRSRLVSRVREGRRVVVVLAPAGSGKSTLVKQVIESLEQSGLRVAQIRCRTQERRSSGLLAALGEAIGEPGLVLAETDAESISLLLANKGVSWVAIDDVHELDGSPGATVLNDVIANSTSPIRWILAGRRAQHTGWGRLRLDNELTEISSDDLRFRLWEIEEVLRREIGRPISPVTVAEMSAATSGWAAGIRLLALAMRDAPSLGTPGVLLARHGGAQHWRHYLADHVLGSQPVDVRRFLMSTAVFDDLTASRCDRLLDSSGSLAVLERLAADGLFTIVEPDGRTYRYHPVFRTFLLDRLVVEFGEGTAQTCHAEASTILETDGDLFGAARSAARAGQWDRTRSLLASADGGGWLSWLSLDDLRPALHGDDPWLHLALARRHLANGALTAAMSSYDAASVALAAEGGWPRAQSERRLLAGWCQPAPGRQGSWVEVLRAILSGGDPSAERHDSQLSMAAAALVNGELQAAADYAARAMSVEVDPAPSVIAAAIRVIAKALQGDTSAAVFDARVLVEHRSPVLDRLVDGLLAIESGEMAGLGSVFADAERERDELSPPFLHLIAGLRPGTNPPGIGCLETAGTMFAELGLTAGATLAYSIRAALGDDVADVDLSGSPRNGVFEALSLVAAARQPDSQRAQRLDRARESAKRVGASIMIEAVIAAAGLGENTAAEHTPGSGGAFARQDLTFQLLGDFAAEGSSGPISLESLRPIHRHLLMLLAAHCGRWLSRDELVGALWPLPAGESDARSHNLQVALSAVRKWLGGDNAQHLLERDQDRYRLSDSCGSDLRLLAQQLRDIERFRVAGDIDQAATRAEAVLAGEGELLPEAGSADWIVTLRRDLWTRVACCGHDVATDLVAVDLRRAAGIARRVVELDPYSDDSWRLAIDLSERCGDSVQAALHRASYEQLIVTLDGL